MQLQTIKSRIRDDIVKGTFDPEARLTIDRLATRYGSSHMPIREALRELAGEGLVRFEPRRGARTLPIDRSFIDNLLTMRAELEPLLARQAAARMDREGLSELEMLQNAFEAAVGRRDDSAAIDMNGRFHSTINQIADTAEACAIVDRHWLLRQHPFPEPSRRSVAGWPDRPAAAPPLPATRPGVPTGSPRSRPVRSGTLAA